MKHKIQTKKTAGMRVINNEVFLNGRCIGHTLTNRECKFVVDGLKLAINECKQSYDEILPASYLE